MYPEIAEKYRSASDPAFHGRGLHTHSSKYQSVTVDSKNPGTGIVRH
jgi:hypothetical protein